jgi:predicted DNA-binding protein (UPF0251 family)
MDILMARFNGVMKNGKDVPMDADDFDMLIQKVDRLTLKSLYAVRLVLVEKMNREDASDKTGLSMKGMQLALSKVARVRMGVRDDWIEVNTGSPEMAAEFMRKLQEIE